MGSRPLDAGSLPRWLAAALILAAAPVLARGGEVLEDVEELAARWRRPRRRAGDPRSWRSRSRRWPERSTAWRSRPPP